MGVVRDDHPYYPWCITGLLEKLLETLETRRETVETGLETLETLRETRETRLASLEKLLETLDTHLESLETGSRAIQGALCAPEICSEIRALRACVGPCLYYLPISYSISTNYNKISGQISPLNCV